MNGSDQPIFRLGDIEVDASTGGIRCGGQELHLRQQTFQVLIYLLQQRHRLVTKEELMDTIWPETTVTPDALVQCIVDIRKALGDDPHQPQFVKTVPKVGYRFIGPVEELRLAAPPAIETEEFTSVEVAVEEETTENDEFRMMNDELPSPVHRSAFIGHRSEPSRRRLALISALVALLVVVPLSIYLGQRLWPSHRPSAEVTPRLVPGKKPLVVMFFENHSGGEDLDWLREGLADMLITDLSRSKRLAVLSRHQLALLLERIEHEPGDPIGLDEALEVARRSRAEAMVLGSFVRLGETVRIDAQLHDATSGQLLAAEHLIADQPEQILTQVDLLSLKLASHLGVGLTEQETPAGLAEVMTDNLEAYRYYSLAVEKAQAWHHTEALVLLEKAIALDPEFAMAHARIGYIHAVIRNNEEEKAKPYLEKAFLLSHRLTEKDRLWIMAWYAQANEDLDGTIRAYRELIAAYPLEVEAHWRLGHLLGQVSPQTEESIAAFKQGLTIDPEAKNIWNSLGLAYCYLGRYGEAMAALEQYVQLAQNEPNAYDSLGMCYNESGRYEDALAAFDRALALDPEFHFAHLHVADVYFGQGRYRAAVRQYQRYIQLAPSDWDRAFGYHHLALLYLKKGDLERAEAAAQVELRLNNDLGGSFLVALARGDLERAERLRRSLFATSPNLRLLSGGSVSWRPTYLGFQTLKTGRGDEAIEYFKQVAHSAHRVLNVDGQADCLANAYMELGRLDEAIAEYERILALNPNYPLAQYHLGQAYERKGERERARAAYEQFLRVWQQADPDLPQLIDAQQRLVDLH